MSRFFGRENEPRESRNLEEERGFMVRLAKESKLTRAATVLLLLPQMAEAGITMVDRVSGGIRGTGPKEANKLILNTEGEVAQYDPWGIEREIEEWRDDPTKFGWELQKDERMAGIAESILRVDGAYKDGLIEAGARAWTTEQLQARWKQVMTQRK